MQKKIDHTEQVVSTTPVIQRVLDSFLDAVAAEEGYLECPHSPDEASFHFDSGAIQL
jgi:hypothetical protein